MKGPKFSGKGSPENRGVRREGRTPFRSAWMALLKDPKIYLRLLFSKEIGECEMLSKNNFKKMLNSQLKEFNQKKGNLLIEFSECKSVLDWPFLPVRKEKYNVF
ncbi:MAG: hypothetical protein HQM08_09535 [Candidatus Riflebacteria bacterium]|nr:hypothetical protein [Candidatus Riflebacteria bacterium]